MDNFVMQHKLLAWFDLNKRKLPWRITKDPYKIWVSEIMLQQTRVDTVIEYYTRFIERFESIEALANADEQEVLKYWQGLGYYSRARNLHKGAKVVAAVYNGKFPTDLALVKKIPGIGEYTAGAILSIAFNLPVPAVDGNVLRVYARLLALPEDIAQPGTIKMIQGKVAESIPVGRASDFTEALMELGALVCVPAAPRCLACPLFEECQARQSGLQEELPIKSKKAKARDVYMVICVIRYMDKMLIVKNPSGGLLGGMWRFAQQEGVAGNEFQAIEKILQQYNVAGSEIQKLGTTRHVFTHMDWKMHVYQSKAEAVGEIKEEHRWVTMTELDQYPLPKVYQKVAALLRDSGTIK